MSSTLHIKLLIQHLIHSLLLQILEESFPSKFPASVLPFPYQICDQAQPKSTVKVIIIRQLAIASYVHVQPGVISIFVGLAWVDL